METDFQKNAYVNLGKFYRSLSDFGLKAIEFHQQALRIAKEIENKYSEGDTCGALSNACHSLGNFKRAVKFHRQAHSIAKEIGAKDLKRVHLATLASCTTFAVILKEQSNYISNIFLSQEKFRRCFTRICILQPFLRK